MHRGGCSNFRVLWETSISRHSTIHHHPEYFVTASVSNDLSVESFRFRQKKVRSNVFVSVWNYCKCMKLIRNRSLLLRLPQNLVESAREGMTLNRPGTRGRNILCREINFRRCINMHVYIFPSRSQRHMLFMLLDALRVLTVDYTSVLHEKWTFQQWNDINQLHSCNKLSPAVVSWATTRKAVLILSLWGRHLLAVERLESEKRVFGDFSTTLTLPDNWFQRKNFACGQFEIFPRPCEESSPVLLPPPSLKL